MIKTAPFRVEDYLDTSEAIAAYLSEALATEDAKYIARAIGTVARSTQGMTVIARETGLSREGLYKSLGTDGNPELATVIKVLRAFGVQLAAITPRA
jgi:probable addiction module antidote protein